MSYIWPLILASALLCSRCTLDVTPHAPGDPASPYCPPDDDAGVYDNGVGRNHGELECVRGPSGR